MKLYKSLKIRLSPNNKQKTLFEGHCYVSKHAYNISLARCKSLFELEGRTPSAIDLHKWLVSEVKKENTWYYQYSKCSPQQAIRDLETAYKNFHRIQKKSGYKTMNSRGQLLGIPKFKGSNSKKSFYLEGSIRITQNKIKLPKIGWVKIFEKPGDTTIKNCVISCTANKWYVSYKIDCEKSITEKSYDVVGIDLGIKNFLTLSDGAIEGGLHPLRDYIDRIKNKSRLISKKLKSGANYKKEQIKLQRLHDKVSNIRKDYIHKLTTRMSKNYKTLVIEDLKVSKMLNKGKSLSRSIIDSGFFLFRAQLFYKKLWYGGRIVVANRYYPSTKTCSNCKNKKSSIKISERIYNCDNCGLSIDRDLNAAINLKDLAASSAVTAFGGELNPNQGINFSDELGMEHQVFIFE